MKQAAPDHRPGAAFKLSAIVSQSACPTTCDATHRPHAVPRFRLGASDSDAGRLFLPGIPPSRRGTWRLIEKTIPSSIDSRAPRASTIDSTVRTRNSNKGSTMLLLQGGGCLSSSPFVMLQFLFSGPWAVARRRQPSASQRMEKVGAAPGAALVISQKDGGKTLFSRTLQKVLIESKHAR